MILFKYFLFFFFYALAVGVLIQKVVLPHYLPHLHGGHGLLAHTDSVIFHERAVTLVGQMQEHGWVAFKNRPQGGVFGITVDIPTIFYYFFTPEPIALLPLNALVHALSGILLIVIVRLCLGRKSGCEWAAMPFIFFPSALSWYAQIHRDGFFILGFFMVILGWARLMDFSVSVKEVLGLFLLIFIGYWLMSTSRNYILQVYKNTLPLLILSLGIWLFTQREKIPGKRITFSFISFVMAALLALPFGRKGLDDQKLIIDWTKEFEAANKGEVNNWTPSSLPAALDLRLQNIAIQRDVSRFRTMASANIDVDPEVGFHKATDVFLYLPRALQIALFAPFPSKWLSKTGRGFFRRLMSMEMVVIYFGLALWLLSFKEWGRRVEFWVMGFFAFALLLIYSLVIVSEGSLYRYRYGAALFLVGIGFARLPEVVKNTMPRVKRRLRLTNPYPSTMMSG